MNDIKPGFPVYLILLIVFIAFLPSLGNGFVTYDDGEYVLANPVIRSFCLDNVKKICSLAFIGNYQPLTLFAYMAEYGLFGVDPFGYHVMSVTLHLLNCLLVLWFIYLLSGRLDVSFIGALLFGIHPLRVESVAWVSEQKDVLYAFFFLGSLISYIYYMRGKRRLRYYSLSLSLFLLSLLSKPMAVTLPLVLILIDYLETRRAGRISFWDKIPFFFLSLIFGAIAVSAQSVIGALHESFMPDIAERLTTATCAVIFYISKMLLPVRLSCIYPGPEKGAYLYACPVVFLALFGAIFFLGRHSRKTVFGLAFFLVTLLPVMKLVSFGPGITADRYTYIPSIGISYGIGEGFAWLWARYGRPGIVRSYLFAGLAGAVAILSVLTWMRCGVWKDGVSLWTDVLRHYPRAAVAYNNRAVAYLDRGDHGRAIRDCDEAINIKPLEFEGYLNRAAAYCSIGNDEAAVRDYKKVAVLEARYAHYPVFAQANSFLKRGRFDEAIAGFTEVIGIEPRYGEAYNNRAVAYFFNKRYDESWNDVRKARELGCVVDPNFVKDLKKASGREEQEKGV